MYTKHRTDSFKFPECFSPFYLRGESQMEPHNEPQHMLTFQKKDAPTFQKKDIIFNEAIGLCQIEEITKLSSDKSAPILYYKLRSLNDKNKVAYIPVENHSVILRETIDVEEAKRLAGQGMQNISDIRKQEIEYVLAQKNKKS